MVKQREQAEPEQESAQGTESPPAEQGGAPEPRQEPAGDTPGGQEGADTGDLQAALEAAQLELAGQRDAMLRMQAEMENLRKRLIRDLERSRKFALERVMSDLLPVRDSLERGLKADAGSTTVDSLLEGKALILRMLGKALEDHGLEEVDPLGEPFNPDLHEAMTMQPSDEYPENTVMEVLQKGFRLNDRLLRPAMVVVSSGAATD